MVRVSMQMLLMLGLHALLAQTYSAEAITSSTSVDRLLTQSEEGWFYRGSILHGSLCTCLNINQYMCWNQPVLRNKPINK